MPAKTTKTMPLADILIHESFSSRQPPREKLQERMARVKKKPGKSPVWVNSRGYLTNGYITYLAALELGIEALPVLPGQDECTVAGAVFRPDGPTYYWDVPEAVIEGLAGEGRELAPGMQLAVRDRNRRVRPVDIVSVSRIPFPSGYSSAIGVWDGFRKKGRGAGKERADGPES